MKRTTPLFVCAALTAGWAAQVASAATVNVAPIQSSSVRLGTPTTVGNASLLHTRNNTSGTDTGKSWLQFDLSSIWTANGQANLQSATLSLWTQNGTSRNFDMSGIADGVPGAETWNYTTMTWNTAPANNIASHSDLNWTDIFGGAVLWQARGGGVLDSTSPAFVNNSKYTSVDLTSFLATDSDGLVTFITTGPPAINSNTRFWGAPGAWQTDPAHVAPVLTLTFTAVPEPAVLSVAMLGLGALLILRRRS